MTTLTSMIRPGAAPTFRAGSRLPAIRGLVVVFVSAIIAAGFVLDVAGGAQPRPRADEARQAVLMTVTV